MKRESWEAGPVTLTLIYDLDPLKRARRLKVGRLIDVSRPARDLKPWGIRHPVAITRDLYTLLDVDAGGHYYDRTLRDKGETTGSRLEALLGSVQASIGAACDRFVRGKGKLPELLGGSFDLILSEGQPGRRLAGSTVGHYEGRSGRLELRYHRIRFILNYGDDAENRTVITIGHDWPERGSE